MSAKAKTKRRSGTMIRVGESRIALVDEYMKMLTLISDHYNLENPSQVVKFLIKKEHKELSANGR